MADKAVKCSSCNVSANVTLEGGIPQKVVCPRCGESESHADFQLSAGHQASAYAADKIGNALKGIAKGNKNIRYKPGSIRQHSPKFRVDLTG